MSNTKQTIDAAPYDPAALDRPLDNAATLGATALSYLKACLKGVKEIKANAMQLPLGIIVDMNYVAPDLSIAIANMERVIIHLESARDFNREHIKPFELK